MAEWEIDPARYGLACDGLDGLAGGEPADNARRIERLLAGENGIPENGMAENGMAENGMAVRCAGVLNAAAGLYVSGGGWTFEEAVARATRSLDSGAAGEALERLRRVTRSYR